MGRSQHQSFNGGMELASFVTSSSLLRKSWDAISSCHDGLISNKGEQLSWKVYQEPDSNLKILAFVSTLDSCQLRPDLLPSSTFKEMHLQHFEFLCTQKVPHFSVNRSAISLFNDNHDKLDQLKYEIHSSTRLIVTGLGLGGSIASLFMISLLDSIWLRKNRPLCITFGKPLMSDKNLQELISRSPVRNSCFLHVVSYKDPVLKRLIRYPPAYMPFGTFLFCSDTNSTCFENPESILELLISLKKDKNQQSQPIDYGNIVEYLNHGAICKDFTPWGQELSNSNSLCSSICLQLEVLGLTSDMQQQHKSIDINALVTKLETLEKKFIRRNMVKFDPSRRLSGMEINMAQLEWYVKFCKSTGIGYYDRNKKGTTTQIDHDMVYMVETLRKYWRDMVEEAKLKPQKESAAFRKSWLHAGTSYRRMVEPFDIAAYYRDGGKDYKNHRDEHFVLLEEWFMNYKDNAKTRNGEYIYDLDNEWSWDFFYGVVDNSISSEKGSKYNPNWDSCTNLVDNHIRSNQGSNYDRNWDSCTSVVDNLIRSEQGSNCDRNWNSCTSVVDNQLRSCLGSVVVQEGKDNSNYDQNYDFMNVIDNLIRSEQGSTIVGERKDNSNYNRQGTFRLQDLDEILHRLKKKNMQNILTFDSCFWAHVEEALLSCKELKVVKENEKEGILKKLVEFEDYVYGLLENYEVSPDIFLQESSYMGWWNEYKVIKGTSYDSKLASFMNNVRNYEQFSSGDYDFF